MNRLTDLFKRFLSPEESIRFDSEVEGSYQHLNDAGNSNIRVLPPDPVIETQMDSKLDNFDSSSQDPSFLHDMLRNYAEKNSKLSFPPPEVLPCANVEVNKYRTCVKPGMLACSSCRLVSYCSKACQTVHWRAHKSDCRNRLRSDEWKPAWIVESRSPSFIKDTSSKEEFESKLNDRFSMGLSLWGNTPAMDVLNLSKNEKDTQKDLSIAFVASGDLRHVVNTVNNLPDNYTGKMSVILNDMTPLVVARNAVLLILLGKISDEATATDAALHFWYSAFIPSQYQLLISSTIASLLKEAKDGILRSELGLSSTLSCMLTPGVMDVIRHLLSPRLSVGEAQDEYDRVRTAPSRRDYRDRMYARLKPSHRVAFQEYRRFGIVLPFGAMNAHFNVPNRSLFSPAGAWLQTDYADPIEGWNIDKIFEIGRSHGAQSEDVYGCLYFFLQDQLRLFAKRLRKCNISFHLTDSDARVLSRGIKENDLSINGIPASVRFDRIQVSNILDAYYVGIDGVLRDWAPLLKDSDTATIVGYFMNWIFIQEDGRATSAGPQTMDRLIHRLMKEGRSPLKNLAKSSNGVPKFSDVETMISLAASSIDALYDNAKPFDAFLKKQGMERILRETNLKLRAKHTIVPHRIKVPLQGSSDAIPEFADDESWYRHVNLTVTTWSERYIELVRDKSYAC